MQAGILENDAITSLLLCLLLSIAYVGSLYMIKSPFPRDHPKTIQQRIMAVAVVCVAGPFFVYYCGNYDLISKKENFTFVRMLGLNLDYAINCFLFPLILTMVLFMGPIILHLDTDGISATVRDLFSWDHFTDIKWYRQCVAAPLSEELIFRACMLPLLVPHFGIVKSIFLAPLLFGVAHLHHIVEGVKNGQELIPVILTSCFQMVYTTIFGAYSAFLFLRTGSLIGSVTCHCFCNMMGFPDFEAISYSNHPKIISFCFVLGLVVFFFLLFPLTDPKWYSTFYWGIYN